MSRLIQLIAEATSFTKAPVKSKMKIQYNLITGLKVIFKNEQQTALLLSWKPYWLQNNIFPFSHWHGWLSVSAFIDGLIDICFPFQFKGQRLRFIFPLMRKFPIRMSLAINFTSQCDWRLIFEHESKTPDDEIIRKLWDRQSITNLYRQLL